MTQVVETSLKSAKARSAVVIGGGIAGLTVAYRLKEEGWQVQLLESNQRIGGALVTQREKGYIAEHGPNTILESDSRITELISQLGLDFEKCFVEKSASKRFVLKNGILRSVPMSPQAFLTSNYFSWNAKLNLLCEPFRKAWNNDHEESLAEFVLRRFGKEFLDYAINPFVAGVYAGNPERLSVEQAFPKLYKLEQRYGSLIWGLIIGAIEQWRQRSSFQQRPSMFSFRKGIGTLPERLEERLGESAKLGTETICIKKDDKLWRVVCLENNNETEFIADVVVYAGTAHQLSALKLEGVSDKLLEPFEQIHHPAISTLTLGFDRSFIRHPLDGFGVLVPEAERRQILGALFISTLFPDRTPSGKVSLTVFIGGTRQPENAALSETELLKLAMDDLRPMLGISGEPDFLFHRYWEKAIPQYDLGYAKVRSQIKYLETHNPGLYFCGNYCRGISVSDTILQALQTAEILFKTFSLDTKC